MIGEDAICCNVSQGGDVLRKWKRGAKMFLERLAYGQDSV